MIGGFVALTTTDMPDSLSAVVFCQGCPWRCRYCHNTHLIERKKTGSHDWSEILRFLARRTGLLDAVVFSGGEPTMQPALLSAIHSVRALGFRVGLHTAGQYPQRLQALLKHVDWVGMDIKAPNAKYASVTGRNVHAQAITQSIKMIINSGVKYEFRTTVHSDLLTEDDIRVIAHDLVSSGAQHYVIQFFRPIGCVDRDLLSSHVGTSLSVGLADELTGCFESFEQRAA